MVFCGVGVVCGAGAGAGRVVVGRGLRSPPEALLRGGPAVRLQLAVAVSEAAVLVVTVVQRGEPLVRGLHSGRRVVGGGGGGRVGGMLRRVAAALHGAGELDGVWRRGRSLGERDGG